MLSCDLLVARPKTAPWRRPVPAPAVSVHSRRQTARSSSCQDAPIFCAAAPLWPAQSLCQHRRSACQQLSSRRHGKRRSTPCQAAKAQTEVQLRQPGVDLQQVSSETQNGCCDDWTCTAAPHWRSQLHAMVPSLHLTCTTFIPIHMQYGSRIWQSPCTALLRSL